MKSVQEERKISPPYFRAFLNIARLVRFHCANTERFAWKRATRHALCDGGALAHMRARFLAFRIALGATVNWCAPIETRLNSYAPSLNYPIQFA